MLFIIYICTRIKPGQYPKLPDFPFSEKHQQYIYQGRELTAEEFNAASRKVFDPLYRNQGYTFRPLVGIPVVEQSKQPVEPTAPEQPPAKRAYTKRQPAETS